jgi:hypothetical protein
MIIANDDASGMTDEVETHVRECIAANVTDRGYFAADGEELGFSHSSCDICNALPGDRYRVNLLVDSKPVIG